MDINNSEKGSGNKIKGFFKNILSWCRKHKIIAAIILIAVVTMAVSAYKLKTFAPAVQAEASYTFVRTTTLTKNGLETVVNCTGSVESADTSTVSYSTSMNVGAPKIKTVNVAVGDYVEAGDIIAVLDNADILEKITEQEEALKEKSTELYEKYEDATEAHEDAYDAYEAGKTSTNNAYNAMIAAQNAFNTAAQSINAFQADYDNAVKAENEAGAAYTSRYAELTKAYEDATSVYNNTVADEAAKKADLESATTEYNKAVAEGSDASVISELETAKNNAETAYNTAVSSTASALTAKNDAEALVNSFATGSVEATNFSNAKLNTKTASDNLETAKDACNYAEYEKAYNNAVTAYNTAVNTQGNLDKQEESARTAKEQAYENYKNNTTNATLEDLYEQLDNCNLKAETNGKITSLNTTVGATVSGTVATIQNTDNLKISVTIQEADINTVEIGMRCNIRSDATEKTISGTLTQIDPVSSMGGSFGAEVTVNGGAQGLLIGMNADVDIVVSAVSDCFTVPADAIGEDEEGSFIYRHTTGEGVDMEFEKVYVNLGERNDYYVEISSDELAVGDVIRSYSDLTIGIEEVTGEDAAQMQGFADLFGGGMPGNMPSGGGMPSGGNFPGGGSGGFPGGDFPSGGGGGQRPEMPGGFGGGGMPSGGGMP